MTVSHRVILLLALRLRLSGGLRRRPLRRALSVTRGGADADDDERRPLRALGVPRGGNDDEDEPYDDVDDEPDDDDDDEARAAKARSAGRRLRGGATRPTKSSRTAFEKALEQLPTTHP